MFKQATLSVLRVLQKLSNASLQLRTVPEAWREDEDMDCISGPDTFEALNKELNEAQQSLKVRDHEDLPLPACFGRCGQRSWTTSCQRRAHSKDAGFSRASTGQVNHLEFCGFRILYQPPYRPTSFKHGLMVLYEKVFVALMISSICGFALFLLRCL